MCGVKFRTKTEDLSKLRVKQLKSILNDRGVECTCCLENAVTEHLTGNDEFSRVGRGSRAEKQRSRRALQCIYEEGDYLYVVVGRRTSIL